MRYLKLGPQQLLALLLLGVILTAGCDKIPFLSKPAENAEAEAEGEGEEETPPEEEPLSEEELLFNAGPQPPIDTYRPLEVKTSDGVKLVGTLYIPGISPYKPPAANATVVSEESGDAEASAEEDADSEESSEEATKPAPAKVKPPKVQYPLVILLHSLSGDRWDWQDMPRDLVKSGYAVLALDMRGHGESTHHGKSLYVWRQFDKADWAKMPADIDKVLDKIAKNPEFAAVNTKRLSIVGGSIGANIAANYGGTHLKQTQAMVLLSTGLDYQGLRAKEPLAKYHNPIYYLASADDAYASDSTERLYGLSSGKKKIKIFQDLGHGTDMLHNDPELSKDIVTWLIQVSPPTPGAPVPSVSTKPEPKTESSTSSHSAPIVTPKPVVTAKPVAKPKTSPVKSVPPPVKAPANVKVPVSTVKSSPESVKTEKPKATTPEAKVPTPVVKPQPSAKTSPAVKAASPAVSQPSPAVSKPASTTPKTSPTTTPPAKPQASPLPTPPASAPLPGAATP